MQSGSCDILEDPKAWSRDFTARNKMHWHKKVWIGFTPLIIAIVILFVMVALVADMAAWERKMIAGSDWHHKNCTISCFDYVDGGAFAYFYLVLLIGAQGFLCLFLVVQKVNFSRLCPNVVQPKQKILIH